MGTKDYWNGAYFMSFGKDKDGISKGSFEPESEIDKKLYIAN